MAIGLGLPGLGLHVPLNLPASAHALPQGGLSSGPSPVIHLNGWPWSRLGPVWALPPDPDPRGAQQQGQESLGPLQAPSGQHWGGEGGGQGDEHAGLGITPPGVHLLCHLLSVSLRQVTNLSKSQLPHAWTESGTRTTQITGLLLNGGGMQTNIPDKNTTSQTDGEGEMNPLMKCIYNKAGA